VPDAQDGEIILHELGHAIQDAICPDFGQTAESGAIGEGFGDYFAASYFERRKPQRYRACVMTWDGLASGLAEGLEPPCLRRVDAPLTFRHFHWRRNRDGKRLRHRNDDVHDNGQIWSSTLWEIREALGRRTADRLIVESHFQLDGFTTFARGARAIIDADRNLNGGRNGRMLRALFQRRHIGPL
jgi:Zn-dependent metalloprotease